MNEIIYISDLFSSDILGGGELNDRELLLMLEEKGHRVTRLRSQNVTMEFLQKKSNCFFIISNFILVNKSCMKFIEDNCKYCIYEHDHKYMITRNPAMYKDFKCPDNELINASLYERARRIFCQSSFHQKIINKNLNLKNTSNLSGNVWSIESLAFMRQISNEEKNDGYSILNSPIGHKNVSAAIKYCTAKNKNYKLVSSKQYQDFLRQLGSQSGFIFMPLSPETLSRVVVEARMMNMAVVSNKNVGATYEPWFKLKGEKLIDYMTTKREEICDKILEAINE
tara:strand:- start:7197 stop:8042 length:846 start_codon:yes stop_codon:yes gene_type:complete